MSRSRSTFSVSPWLLLAIIVIILSFAQPVSAFGAGNVPSYSYLEHKAFRHGDIEDTLEKLSKVAGGGFMGLGKKKFGGLDIKRIYFGNWLRDFSQAMDTAALTKVSKQAILNLIMVMGFMTHGYATEEFKVTEERLGVYLPVEHIDNPKGYNDNKDARPIHPMLRPPVERVELEVDPRTGMKNYIANDNGHWDTSTKFIRRTLERCIQLGRSGIRSKNDAEIYEAYRLLGTALHTLEDLPAHSNFCELALLRMGHHQVFCHVGSNVKINSPAGPCPPLVTGTFGGNDFLHSMLGEAGDHLSQVSVSDLQQKCDQARSMKSRGGSGGIDSNMSQMLSDVPGMAGGSLSREMDQVSRDAAAQDPDTMSPEEMYATLWKILTIRDKISKSIEATIEKIPGLNALVDKISDAVSVWVFQMIEPYAKPLMVTATQALSSGSEQIINDPEQYKVFDDANASDPTHSFLSKDHFDDLLNEPAGNLAVIIIKHSVQHVVKAWHDENIDIHQCINVICEAIHHPWFADTSSPVQSEMAKFMQDWFREGDQDYILKHLTATAVRNGDNKRKGTSAKPSDQSQYNSFLPPPSELLGNIKNSFQEQSGPQRDASSSSQYPQGQPPQQQPYHSHSHSHSYSQSQPYGAGGPPAFPSHSSYNQEPSGYGGGGSGGFYGQGHQSQSSFASMPEPGGPGGFVGTPPQHHQPHPHHHHGPPQNQPSFPVPGGGPGGAFQMPPGNDSYGGGMSMPDPSGYNQPPQPQPPYFQPPHPPPHNPHQSHDYGGGWRY